MSQDDLKEIKTEMNEFDLDELDQEQLDTGDQEQTENGDVQDVVEVLNDPEVIADMIMLGVGELFPMYPSLEKVYTKERCLDLATKSCAVANKRGVSILGFFSKYMEEIMLGITCISLIRATYQAVDHDMQVAEKAKVEEEEKVDEAA